MKSSETKSKSENVHAEHRQRMFEKVLKNLTDSFADHELLEVLLFFSRPRVNTNEIAHALLNKFSSFRSVFEAKIADLKNVSGIGLHSALLIKVVYACIRRYEKSIASSMKYIRSTKDAGKYFISLLFSEPYECSQVLMLDNSDRIIGCLSFGSGTVNQVNINYNNLLEDLLPCHPAGIYIAHNHPRGEAIPSNDDLNLTDEIREMCYKLNIDFKDHIIVADDKYCSVMEYLEKRR